MLRIIWLLKVKSLKAQLQYPLNFALSAVGVSFIGGMDIMLLVIPARVFGTIGGWDIWALGFMFALWKLSHNVHQAIFLPFWGHDNLVRTGAYDLLLARPVHPIWQILTSEFYVQDLGIPSLAMLFITAPHVRVPWNAATIAFLVLLILSGAVIEFAVSLFLSGFGFWFVQTSNLRGIAHTFLFRVANYPIHIYGRVFAFIMTFVFPYAFMAYYPTQVFFRLEPVIYPGYFAYLPPVVAVVGLALAYGFWSLGLKRYQSTGT
jgi:ABC-2 type transport system permease protein